MLNKSKEPKSLLDDYVFINSQNYSIEKKPSAMQFFFTELSIYLLISLASYFSVYLGTHQFTNEKALVDNIDLLTKYFSNSNLENSLLGICIVIGLVSSLNYLVTNSAISLKKFLDRLTHSFLDLIFLMLSSMIGLFFAILEFTSVLNITPTIEKLRSNVQVGAVILTFALLLYVIVLLIIHINKNKILK